MKLQSGNQQFNQFQRNYKIFWCLSRLEEGNLEFTPYDYAFPNCNQYSGGEFPAASRASITQEWSMSKSLDNGKRTMIMFQGTLQASFIGYTHEDESLVEVVRENLSGLKEMSSLIESGLIKWGLRPFYISMNQIMKLILSNDLGIHKKRLNRYREACCGV